METCNKTGSFTDPALYNALIRDLAIRGGCLDEESPYWMDMDLYWKILGPYVVVYMESWDYSYGFRIFECEGEGFYDRKLVQARFCENDSYRCLFAYDIDSSGIGRTDVFADGNWRERFVIAAAEYLGGG